MSQLKSPEPTIARQYVSYTVGFFLSVAATLAAFYVVMQELFSTEIRVYTILAIAVFQLIVQMVFFLHVGRGSRWKAITFYFTLLIVAIIVVGTLWIMHNLDYNMMHMSPEEVQEYMSENQGI